MNNISELLGPGIRTCGIAGHVNPDGDCVGSCTALYLYLRRNAPEIRVDLYLEQPKPVFALLEGVGDARQVPEEGMVYDLFITCDVSEENRIGVAGGLFRAARMRAVIDHHVTNPGFGDVNHVEPEASSCAEVLTGLLDMERIDRSCASLLYSGMIHDSGVFQYRNTTPRTLRLAAQLMEKGVDFSSIIDRTFNQRTYTQNRVLGHALETSRLSEDGRCVWSVVTEADMAAFGATCRDLDMIVSQLRYTAGTDAAVFLYETAPGVFKVSFRSGPSLNVAEVAGMFGGGGHVQAAGCTLKGEPDDVIGRVLGVIREKLP